MNVDETPGVRRYPREKGILPPRHMLERYDLNVVTIKERLASFPLRD